MWKLHRKLNFPNIFRLAAIYTWAPAFKHSDLLQWHYLYTWVYTDTKITIYSEWPPCYLHSLFPEVWAALLSFGTWRDLSGCGTRRLRRIGHLHRKTPRTVKRKTKHALWWGVWQKSGVIESWAYLRDTKLSFHQTLVCTGCPGWWFDPEVDGQGHMSKGIRGCRQSDTGVFVIWRRIAINGCVLLSMNQGSKAQWFKWDNVIHVKCFANHLCEKEKKNDS